MFGAMKRFWPLLAGVCLIGWVLLTGCRRSPSDLATDEASITNYTVRGVVKSMKPEDLQLVIKHEEIPGYMMAMTMPFSVRDTNELRGVTAGDSVEFRMRVTERDGWIDQLRVTSNPTATESTNSSPVTATPTTNAPSAFRVLPNVPELKLGDLIPDYALTNQQGVPFKLSDFRGQALAITFIFTRCPFPLFCPRVTDGFATTQKLLLSRPNGPTNWQLLSLTFDPEYDSPETMKAYGQRWKADPKHWTLATGAFDQIEPLAISVGLYFGRGVSIADQNHNLRTLVISPTGHLVQQFPGNQWTGEELAAALTAATEAKDGRSSF